MSSAKLSMIRDNFSLTSWLLTGACLQSLLHLLLPSRATLLPAIMLLLIRFVNGALVTKGYINNTYLEDVSIGVRTNVIPNEDGSIPEKGSGKEVVVFIVGASTHHPLGLFAPGFKDLGQYFQNMWNDAEANRANSGYLGKSGPLSMNDKSGRTVVTLSYWQDLDHLHAFAQGASHRAGWDWWTKVAKEHPHIGIMHETYCAPNGHWETICQNFQPFGMGQTKHLVKGKDKKEGLLDQPDRLVSALVEAKGTRLASMLARMDRVEPGLV